MQVLRDELVMFLLPLYRVITVPAPAAAESLSRVQPCATPETPAYQAPRSLGLSRQEHWSGLPFPSPNHCAYLGAKKYPPQLRAGRFRSRSWV